MMESNKKYVLALNAGSSSLKASLLDGETRLVNFLAERLSSEDAILHIRPKDEKESSIDEKMSHAQALSKILEYLDEKKLLQDVVAVGHRVVHGGLFTDSVLIDDCSLGKINNVSNLAPLHNPHNVAGIEAIRSLRPSLPNVAVFDTSFHATLPEKAFTYPIPKSYRDKGMRKYGFHGTSVKYVTQKAEEVLSSLKTASQPSWQLIVCHLGNGASVTAVSSAQSKETSMGFTPLAGLMMGTRCGDIDPSLVGFACHELDKDVDEVLQDLNKSSGLKGIATDGASDMRVLLSGANSNSSENPSYKLAVDMFVYRLAQHIASSMVALDAPLDALVFTAGIGEHSSEIRRRTVEQLKTLIPSLELENGRNDRDGEESGGVLSPDGCWPVILDIATDEEAMIAKECVRIVEQ